MVELLQPPAQCRGDDLEIANHFVGVEILSLDDKFDLARVTVGKPAFVRVLGQHVTILDFDGFADSIWHKFKWLGENVG